MAVSTLWHPSGKMAGPWRLNTARLCSTIITKTIQNPALEAAYPSVVTPCTATTCNRHCASSENFHSIPVFVSRTTVLWHCREIQQHMMMHCITCTTPIPGAEFPPALAEHQAGCAPFQSHVQYSSKPRSTLPEGVLRWFIQATPPFFSAPPSPWGTDEILELDANGV